MDLRYSWRPTGQAATNGIGSRLIAISISDDLWEVIRIPAPSSLLGAGSPLTVLSSGAAPLGSVPVADGGGGIGWDALPGGGSPPWSVYDESALVISNDVETNFVLQAIPAATLSTNGSSIKFDIVSLLLNNTGANQVITPRLKLGGTTVYADASGNIATSTATRACKFVGNIIRVSATTARISATLIIGGAQGATTGGGDFGSSALRVCPVYSILATVDWSAPVEFICSVQLGATAANFTLTRQFFAMQPVGAAGAKGDTGEPGQLTRSTVGYTTSNLADAASEDFIVEVGKVAKLLSVTVSHASWIRFYSSAAQRTADIRTAPGGTLQEMIDLGSARPYAEVATTGASETVVINSSIFGDNDGLAYVRLRNNSGGSAAITLDSTVLTLEP